MGDGERWIQPDGTPGTTMWTCLGAAAQAPSIHNSQPWLFEVRGTEISVLADRSRQVHMLDPDGRALLLSVGAAVLNLRVAVRASGRVPRVRLFPDPHHPELAATVTLGDAAPPSAGVGELAQAIGRRHTNRRPFTSASVADTTLAALSAAAMLEGGTLVEPDPVGRHEVLDLARTANRQEYSDSRYRDELAAWTAPVPGRVDGVPREAFGPRPDPGTLPLRDFGLVHARHRHSSRFEPTPTITVLYSHGDEPVDWLRSGMALQRILLMATAHGLASTILTQPTELPGLRAHLARPRGLQAPQVVLRFGYARPAPFSPRRPLHSLVVADADAVHLATA